MRSGLSIFFNIDRVYLAILSESKKGLNLEYVEATRNRVDLENPDDPKCIEGINEIISFIDKVKHQIDHLNVTIPAESVFVTQFPGEKGITEDQLKKLVNLEIKQAYPQFNTNEFVSNIYPLEPDKNNRFMMLASIMQRDILETISKVFKDYLPISNVEISQINAHTAFLYNYPESLNKNIIILGIQDQFIDLSLIKNSKPAYYNLLSFSNKDKLADMVQDNYQLLLNEVTDKVDGIYFFGTGLTKDLFFQATEKASYLGLETNRLNAFRMMSTSLNQRQKDYCSIVQHIFPPAIGALIPDYHQRIRIF